MGIEQVVVSGRIRGREEGNLDTLVYKIPCMEEASGQGPFTSTDSSFLFLFHVTPALTSHSHEKDLLFIDWGIEQTKHQLDRL